MIIKQADDKKAEIKTLRELALRHDCLEETRQRIENKIRKINAGIYAEQETAYETKIHWADSRDWVVIHDLRIEVEDLSAQIDHLIINRFLDIWVCETKHFSKSVSINEHGEFFSFFGEKPYGIPSPIEQNAKHIKILSKLLASPEISIPKNRFLKAKPNLISLILISKDSHISRPQTPPSGIGSVIKTENIFSFIKKEKNQQSTIKSFFGKISEESLINFGQQLVAQHRPKHIDFFKLFGFKRGNSEIIEKNLSDISAAPPLNKEASESETPPAPENLPGFCNDCGQKIHETVALFCWSHPIRFNHNTYCRACQKKFPPLNKATAAVQTPP